MIGSKEINLQVYKPKYTKHIRDNYPDDYASNKFQLYIYNK